MTDLHAVIIDDQPANLEVLGRLLQQQHISYTGVRTSRGVESVIEELPRVDVVFLDLEIPGEEGYYSVLHRLRSLPCLADAPIVAYTVHASEIQEAREMGFDGFLGKPLKSAQFGAQLQRILNREPVWDY